MAFKFVLMLSIVVFAAQASPTPDDQTKINAAQTILTLTNSLVGIKNLLSGKCWNHIYVQSVCIFLSFSLIDFKI
jgi:hypothetical protein